MESNSFREFTHISLRFRQGNDEAIKKHLAGRLEEFKRNLADAGRQICQLEDEKVWRKQELEERSKSLQSARTELDGLRQSAETQRQGEVAELKERHVKELREAQREASAELQKQETELRTALEAALARAEKAERENEELRQVKFVKYCACLVWAHS